MYFVRSFFLSRGASFKDGSSCCCPSFPASGSQEVRVGRLEVAGVRARGEAGDVDIEAQALATLKLQGSRAQGSSFTLRTGCSALFDLYLEPVRQDLRHFGHHLRIRLFGLLPKVRVQDLPRARQENHSRPIAVPSSEVAAHLQAHQPSTVENNGLGLLLQVLLS